MKKAIYTVILFSLLSSVSYSQMYWQQESNFGGVSRHAATSFSLNGYGYIVGGYTSNNNVSNEVWMFDPTNDSWVQKSALPKALYGSTTFVLNDTAYLCNGWISTNGTANSNLYRYNEALDVWDSISIYPGTPAYTTTSFVLNGKAYIGIGYNPLTNELWSYDPNTNSWASKAIFPGQYRQNCNSWVINNRAFVGLGASSSSAYSDIYEYIDSTDTWVLFGNFPGGGRYAAVALSISGDVYVGCGYDLSNFKNDMWVLDHYTMNWTQVSNYGGAARHSACGFVINNLGYYGIGRSSVFYNDMWRFVPASLNVLQGHAFVDNNSNSLPDSAEAPVKQLLVAINPGNKIYSTDVNGIFRAPVDTLSYSVTILNPPAYYTLGQAPANVTFSSTGITDSSTLIPYVPNGPVNDLKIDLTAITPVRPGFDAFYTATYSNLGTTSMDTVTIRLVLDTGLYFTTTEPYQPVYYLAGDTIVFVETNLLPGESRNFGIRFNASVVLNFNDTVTSSISIWPLAGDQDSTNNSSSSTMGVVGSFDPNDITVSKETITPQNVLATDWLEYTIRFQNTGTYPATYVRIIDSIPPQLDLATFQILSSSSPAEFEIKGDHKIKFNFPGINLADSNSNEPLSHGFVKYRMRVMNNLVIGDYIDDYAAIYFDYNTPVITNTAHTIVVSPTGLETIKAQNTVSVYPNPASNLVNYKFIGSNKLLKQINILDLSGRKINTIANPGLTQSKLPALTNGIYLLEFQFNNGSKNVTRIAVNN